MEELNCTTGQNKPCVKMIRSIFQFVRIVPSWKFTYLWLIHNKACGPNSVPYLDQTPIFEWNMGRCGTKNRYHKSIV